MPISINGSGSITGINAGGLPDASVTVDDIASGAVTPAKLSTGGPNWDSSGRLLVGTSSAFTDANTDPQKSIIVSSTYTDGIGLGLYHFQNDANWTGLRIGRSKTNTVGGHGALGGSDTIGFINFEASDGSAFKRGATITAVNDQAGAWASGDCPTRLVFSTCSDGSATPQERLRITSGTSNGANFLFNCTSFPSSSVKGTAIAPNSSVGNCLTNGVNVTTACAHLEFYNPNGSVGSIQTNGSSTSYATSSDYRLKENVEPVTGGITRLQQLKPSRFNFIADPDKTVDGFIAHEVQAVVPEAITGEKDAVDDDGNPIYQGIDQSKLVPLLTAALQEAITKIETLEARLTAAGIA